MRDPHLTDDEAHEVFMAIDFQMDELSDAREVINRIIDRRTGDLRSRLACILEASAWDRPYDTRLAAIRGMCDLTTNGMTPAPLPDDED